MRDKIVDSVWLAVKAQKEIFYKNGYLAVKANEAQKITPALESVLAIILNMSGTYRAGMGLNLAHALDEVLLEFEPCRNLLHGFIIGYAVIPMMVYANYPIEEIYEYVDFATSIGLPVNMEQLGIADISHKELEKASEKVANSKTGAAALACNKFTKDDFWKNMLLADKLVNEYLSSK